MHLCAHMHLSLSLYLKQICATGADSAPHKSLRLRDVGVYLLHLHQEMSSLCSSGLFTTSMDYIISQNRSLLKTMNHGKKIKNYFFF